MTDRRPDLTRRRIAAFCALVIVVALGVSMFAAGADLRRNRDSNRDQLVRLDELAAQVDGVDELTDVLRRQSALLAALPTDLDASTAALADQLADATARLLAAHVPITTTTPERAAPNVVVVNPQDSTVRPVEASPGVGARAGGDPLGPAQPARPTPPTTPTAPPPCSALGTILRGVIPC